MKNTTKQAMLVGALLLASALAHAQYAWIDEKGTRQYSDKPPPPDTPSAKILKLPRGMARPDDPPAAAPAAAGAAAAPTLADREADYRKRHDDAAKAGAKAATAAATADSKRVQCEAAQRSQEQIDTGRRLRNPNDTVMTEEEKAAATARNAKIAKDCKT